MNSTGLSDLTYIYMFCFQLLGSFTGVILGNLYWRKKQKEIKAKEEEEYEEIRYYR